MPKFRLSDLQILVSTLLDQCLYGNRDETHKAYILPVRCANTHAVQLELVPDVGGPSLVNALNRFQARRRVPAYIISDNGTTFKNKHILSNLRRSRIRWDFNVESCPWSGGFFERHVRSVKRCLRKTLRKF